MARLSKKTYKQINNSKSLQAALAAKGRVVASTARSITASEGGEAQFTVVSGVRPGGRAFTNVVSSSAAEEYGTETQKRIRALGRAQRATK